MDDQDIPDFRRTIRAHLAERPSVSLSAATIHRHCREYQAKISEVEKALAVLVALGHVSTHFDPLGGSTTYYQATAAGILAHERGE